MEFQAIETRYKGHLFRSRLEARHAVLFDYLGLRWEYEPEGFKMGDALYLPDFHLPDIGWIEVKGQYPNSKEIEKCGLLGDGTTASVFISYGQLEMPSLIRSDTLLRISPFWDDGYRFCQCKICGKVGLEYSGRSERINCTCSGKMEKAYNSDTPLIEIAYQKAIEARFEHGENPWMNSIRFQ